MPHFIQKCNAPCYSQYRKWNNNIPCFEISSYFLLSLAVLTQPSSRQDCPVYTVQLFCTVLRCSCFVQLYNAAVVYRCTMQLLCTLVQCSRCVFYKSSLYFLFKCTMPRIIHKTGYRITSYHALLSAVTFCYNMQSCLSLQAGRIDYTPLP